MNRNIFIVNAIIVDANGTYNVLSGYPKNFDSRSYNDDVAKARKRADGEFADTWGTFCKRDDRMIQTVTISNVKGEILDRKTMGEFIFDEPEPEPEPEEPEETEEP